MIRRNTPTKDAILQVLSTSGKALSQDAIERRVELKVNRATIYRVLNQFCEDDIVHKIVAEDGKQYFAICRKCENPEQVVDHFHFRCLSCESIECLQIPVEYTAPDGYAVERTNCLLTGTCRDCNIA